MPRERRSELGHMRISNPLGLNFATGVWSIKISAPRKFVLSIQSTLHNALKLQQCHLLTRDYVLALSL